MHNRGRLLVIEGIDGSGKATQSARLQQALKQQGYPVRGISFPDYSNPSSALVKLYLSGAISSDPNEVNPYAASSFYSADRYISYLQHWQEDYQSGTVMVADRYATSNAVHQMPKLPRDSWNDYLMWLDDFEYNKLLLPRPDRVIYLDMHPRVARKLMAHRYDGDESKKDIHESNDAYLLACREAALYAAQFCGWQIISCFEGEEPRALDAIANEVLAAAIQAL